MEEFFVKTANCMLRYNDFPGEQTPIFLSMVLVVPARLNIHKLQLRKS